MQWILVMIGIVLAILVLAMIPVVKTNREEYARTGKHPKGHYLSMGIGLGMILGIPIGVAIGNIGLGPAMGLPIGIAIGTALEKQHEDELRPKTPREAQMQRRMYILLAALLVTGLVAFLAVAWLSTR